MTSPLTGPLADTAARHAALTDLSHGLLVEAGAGSGKTAILAGRVAWLLASGVVPRQVAAITFTERAAAELSARVREYVSRLAEGVVPAPLAEAFGAAPTAEQARNLAAALGALDELTSTTIHGFARELTLPYPVEAGLDPGATVLDAADADLLFDDVFGAWLRRALADGPAGALLDPVALILAHPAAPSVEAVKELARLLRSHPEAAPPTGPLAPAAARALGAGERVRRLIEAQPLAPEPLRELAVAVEAYCAQVATAPGGAEAAVAALSGETGPIFTQQATVRRLRAKGAWEAAATAAGASKADAAASYAALAEAHAAFAAAVEALTAASVDHLLASLASALGEMVGEYRAAKRELAVLDFDDLIADAAALLRDHEPVRAELAERYRYVLVDEFQDTDPLQAEIVWRLTGRPLEADWREWPALPGARFVVGDPNQSIYRFRGADPETYTALRDELRRDPGSRVLTLTENFRSVPALLVNANHTFSEPLSAPDQAGYSELGARRPETPGSALVRLEIVTGGGETVGGAASDPDLLMEAKRAAEAQAVADLCRALVDGTTDLLDGPVSPGDIALLAPAATGLEHHERALEALGLDVASQAGKGFYRRQEVQDMVALTCALADPANTLALGAFLSGPMVGATLEELLDVAHALKSAGQDHRLSLATDPGLLPVPRLAEVLAKLQALGAARDTTTPYALLTEAAEVLELRATLVNRHPRSSERAIANLDRFLQGARAYDLRGLRAYADATWQAWDDGETALEGQVDAAEDAIALITMHSAKGLEWRVVIPVGSMGGPSRTRPVWFSRRARRPVMKLLGHDGTDAAELLEQERSELLAERMRLWYVAATRARDLLVVPSYDFGTPDEAWCNLAEWQEVAPWRSFRPAAQPSRPAPTAAEDRAQTREEFSAESAAIARGIRRIERRAPSRLDDTPQGAADQHESYPPAFTPELGAWILDELDATADTLPPSSAYTVGTARGILLHKLLEEVIGGRTEPGAGVLATRAGELLAALAADDLGVDPAEVAAMAHRAWHVPEVQELAPHLLAEVAVTGTERGPAGGADIVWSGVADAVAFDHAGRPTAVIDWKSDRSPVPATLDHYREQVRTYLRLTGAARGLIVLASSGEVLHVTAR